MNALVNAIDDRRRRSRPFNRDRPRLAPADLRLAAGAKIVEARRET
jgi:hypothetical protein